MSSDDERACFFASRLVRVQHKSAANDPIFTYVVKWSAIFLRVNRFDLKKFVDEERNDRIFSTIKSKVNTAETRWRETRKLP